MMSHRHIEGEPHTANSLQKQSQQPMNHPSAQPALQYKVEEYESKYIILIEVPEEVKQQIATIQKRRRRDASLKIKCTSRGFILDVVIEQAYDGTMLLSRNFVLSDDVDQDQIYSAILSDGDHLLVVLPKRDDDSTEESTTHSDSIDDPGSSPLRLPRRLIAGLFGRNKKHRGECNNKAADAEKIHYAETVIHP